MSDGDLFREVDQALRQERYRLLWDRYGYYIIGGATLIVLVVAGYRGWVYWQETQAQQTGAQFVSALELLQAESTEDAEQAFQDLATEASRGYKTLARFQLAATDADAGNIEQAVARYDTLAEDRSVGPILRGNAAIQAATLRLPNADYAEMERRLEPLIEQNSPWRYSAHDLLGLSAYRVGDMQTAQDHFNTLLADSGTPANLRERSSVMLAVIAGAISSGHKPTEDAPASDEAPPAADSAAPAEEATPPPAQDSPEAPAERTPAEAGSPASQDTSSEGRVSSEADGSSDESVPAPDGDAAADGSAPAEETSPAVSD